LSGRVSGETNLRLDGKTAIVTGGGSGIGKAIALCFAANGASVRILDVNHEQGEQTAKQISAAGGKASAHVCDVTDLHTVRKTFEHIFELGRVDILVNNAGVSHIGNVETTSQGDFERVMSVNVWGYYHTMQTIVGHLKAKGGGVILNIASIAATAGLADRFAYATSKGAVVAMTYSVARDFISHKIRCNCISPARVHTPFVDDYLQKNYPGREKEMYDKLAASAPIGRMGEPEEVASLALFLCSDQASFLTGVDYPLDGGFFNLHG
jgi:NAD(P)-dependent dehydrogenase (short-subunit alcohol dehydrogenase family)